MIPRLYLKQDLTRNEEIVLSDDAAHYVRTVLRRASGDTLRLFNERHGEFNAEIIDSKKSAVRVRCGDRQRAPVPEPDVGVYFAPLKKEATDFLVEKATELGARFLQPVRTARTNTHRVASERLQKNALEAAEQTERLTIPHVHDLKHLDEAMAAHDPRRPILLGDETRAAPPLSTALRDITSLPLDILVGPEGGWDAAELARLKALPFILPVHLGPRILRADTAVMAMLTLVQSTRGDWT